MLVFAGGLAFLFQRKLLVLETNVSGRSLLQPGGILGLQSQPDPAIFLGHYFPGETGVVGGSVSVSMEPLHRAGVK